MLRIAIANTTSTNYTSNVWVIVEIKDLEFALLKDVRASSDFAKIYFVDQDKTTSLSFFRLVWNFNLKYALFAVQLPSLAANSVRYIYLKTDSGVDRASISTTQYFNIYMDLKRYGLINLTGSPTPTPGNKQITFSIQTSTANDVFACHVYRAISATSMIAISAGNSGIGFSSNNIGYRNGTYTSLPSTTGEYTILSKAGTIIRNSTVISVSGGTYSAGSTCVVSNDSTPWIGSIYRVVYIRDPSATWNDNYYYALRRFWLGEIRSVVSPEGLFKFKELVVSWDESGVQVYDPNTKSWRAIAFPAVRYDGTRIITLSAESPALMLSAAEHNSIISEETARFWSDANVLIQKS